MVFMCILPNLTIHDLTEPREKRRKEMKGAEANLETTVSEHLLQQL